MANIPVHLLITSVHGNLANNCMKFEFKIIFDPHLSIGNVIIIIISFFSCHRFMLRKCYLIGFKFNSPKINRLYF